MQKHFFEQNEHVCIKQVKMLITYCCLVLTLYITFSIKWILQKNSSFTVCFYREKVGRYRETVE